MGSVETPLGAVKKKKNLSAGRLPRKTHDAVKTSQNNASFGIAITDSWIMSLATFLDDVLVLEHSEILFRT